MYESSGSLPFFGRLALDAEEDLLSANVEPRTINEGLQASYEELKWQTEKRLQ